MGRETHFVGEVRGAVCVDLFSDVNCEINGADLSPGDIVEVKNKSKTLLAKAGSAEARLYHIAAKHKMDPVFPAEVEAQVAELVNSPGIDDPSLEDLTALPFVTIDGETSRDLDQAVFVDKQTGGFLVHYALADAAHFVRAGTPLFDEALSRGASYYLPGFMVPMLPRELSEDLVSLNPNLERRALLFSMRLDESGVCEGTTIRRVRIKSHGKLSFPQVQRYYDGASENDEALTPEICENLDNLKAAGLLRMARAELRGVVEYRRRSVSTDLLPGGMRFSVQEEVRREVERYNEQMSLLCNMEGARLLKEAHGDFVEPIYRAHPAPTEEKMQAFEESLAALVKARELPESWLWTRTDPRPLARYLDELPQHGPEANIASAIHRQAVIANVRSMYQKHIGGHHGVGASAYGRFSAPMREIVGIFLHQELIEATRGHGKEDETLRDTVVTQGNRSRSRQRNVTNDAARLVIDQIAKTSRDADKMIRGVLMGAAHKRAYVRMDSPPLDLKVDLDGESGVRVTDKNTTLKHDGQVVARIGDEVGLRVSGFDEARDRWRFSFVSLLPSQ